MTNKDITKIYFQGNEIVALYQGSTLIFKKSGSVVPPSPKPTGTYIVRGTLKPDSRERNIQLCVNGKREQFDVNNDKTFEYTFTNVPVTNMDNFTLQCKDELKTLDLSDLDTSQVTSMNELFYQCSNLESLDISNLDTSNITNTSWLFSGCSSLQTLDLSSLDTSKVTNMSYMFQNCSSLQTLDLSSLDTSKVTNMFMLFYGCKKLETLDLSNFNTSNVTNMRNMFQSCSSLQTLDLSSLDTSKVTVMSGMFLACENLINLYINMDVSSIDGEQYGAFDFTVFQRDYKLTNVVGKFEGTKYDLDLEYCPLTAASAMVFINGLATVTEKRTLKLSATTYDSLTKEQIAIATSKGWTVTRE